MKLEYTDRGFEVLVHETYGETNVENARLVQQSSGIHFPYPGAQENPGSSFLWIGEKHHLNREQIKELVNRLQAWLETGSLGI